MKRALTPLLGLLLVAACGDDNSTSNTTATSSDDTTVETTAPAATEALRYVTTGGCLMMGPNCATYVVYSDGTVEVYRTGENTPAEVVGSIPAAEITAFLDSVQDTDFDALATEVGPGTCNACVDGIDVIATLTFADGPVTLDSTVVNFDLSHPFFANLETLMEDVRAVGELPIQQRG